MKFGIVKTLKFGISYLELLPNLQTCKKITIRGISRLIRNFRGSNIIQYYPENNNPEEAETAKFWISNLENLYWYRIYKNLKKKIYPGISR